MKSELGIQLDLFSDRPLADLLEDLSESPLKVFRYALEMEKTATIEWRAFLESVRTLRKAQRDASSGMPWSKDRRRKAEMVVDMFFSEWDSLHSVKTDLPDFLKGGAS